MISTLLTVAICATVLGLYSLVLLSFASGRSYDNGYADGRLFEKLRADARGSLPGNVRRLPRQHPGAAS